MVLCNVDPAAFLALFSLKRLSVRLNKYNASYLRIEKRCYYTGNVHLELKLS
jgi:hypothetical protein